MGMKDEDGNVPGVESKISTGNLINLVALIIAMGVAWGVMRESGEQLQKSLDAEITARRSETIQMDTRVRVLEAGQARTDEKFISVLQSLDRIEKGVSNLDRRINSQGARP